MSLLDHPEAQALLNDAVLTPEAVTGCADRLTGFLQRYLPRFYRVEQPATPPWSSAACSAAWSARPASRSPSRPACPQADPVLRRRRQVGRRGGHGRVAAPRPRGVGRARRRRGHRPQRLPQEGDRVLRRRPPVVRPARQGRQLPGRRLPGLCRPGGYAPLDRRLYLPEDWADDAARRAEVPRPAGGRVPGEVADRAWTCWTGACPACPTAGSPATTSSAGPPSSAPGCLRRERYVLDVPCNTTVRDLERRRPPRKRAGVGRKREVPFVRADAWAAGQPESRWERMTRARRREGAAGGRRDGGAGPGQAGRPDRAGGTPGGDPAGGRVTPRLEAVSIIVRLAVTLAVAMGSGGGDAWSLGT